MNTFSIGESIRFGWDAFWMRPWFFIGVSVLVCAISAIAGHFVSSGAGAQAVIVVGSGYLISFLVNILVKMGVTNLFLKAHDAVGKVQFEDLWAPAHFVSFLIASILVVAIVIVGLILLIVPGIIFALRYSMTPFIVIDRGLDAMSALKESARITYGHKWKLLGFLITLALVNILGAICLLIGLLVTIPLSQLAFVHVYRSLSKAHA